MALELVLLVSFVGMTFVSTFGNSETGLKAQFDDSAPILAARMERKMASGRCLQVSPGGSQPCDSILFESGSTKR